MGGEQLGRRRPPHESTALGHRTVPQAADAAADHGEQADRTVDRSPAPRAGSSPPGSGSARRGRPSDRGGRSGGPGDAAGRSPLSSARTAPSGVVSGGAVHSCRPSGTGLVPAKNRNQIAKAAIATPALTTRTPSSTM